MAQLRGEAVLITGGASGLGAAVVERFLDEGADLTVLDRSEERLKALGARHGGRIEVVMGDVRRLADNQRAVEASVSRYGKLDCAIGNAGVWDYSVPLDALPEEALDASFDEMFHINVKGYINLAKAALPALARARGGLIYTVSNAGFDPAGGGVLYTAAKHAVVGMIRQLAFEFAPVVRVNGVAPGPIQTDLRGLGALGLSERSISGMNLASLAGPSLPVGKVPEVQEYVGGYVLLASRRDNQAATGAVLRLDAGIEVRGIGRTSAGGGLAKKYPAPEA